MKRLLLIMSWAAIALATPVARAATADQTLAALNAQRAANGLPAGLTLNPTWSADCALHDHYMAINGLTHDEVKGNHGYTDGGAFAGRGAVISQGASWDHGNPYESAPIHLDQLLAPRLLSIGTADAEGYSCTTTFPGWSLTDPPGLTRLTVYTYPGDGARIYPSETAVEDPWTPGDLVGIPHPARTGPYLYVLVDAPGQAPAFNPATLSGATLTGPSGPVAVKTVDGNTQIPGGGALAGYLSPGGFIIPVAPLTGGATYRAHVDVTFGGQTIAHDWTFTTSAVTPARAPSLHFGAQSIKAGKLHVALAYGSQLKGRHATLTITQLTVRCTGGHCAPMAGSSSHRTITLGPTTALDFPRPAKGHGLRLTLDTAAFQQGGVPWAAAHARVDIIRRK